MKDGDVFLSETVALKCSCGTIYTTTLFKQQERHKPVKIFLHLGKAGGCAAAHLHGISQLINQILEDSSDNTRLRAFTALTGFQCHQEQGTNCHDVIAQYLINHEIIQKRQEEEE